MSNFRKHNFSLHYISNKDLSICYAQIDTWGIRLIGKLLFCCCILGTV